MPEIKAFIDANVLVYLFSEDAQKAHQAENIIRSGAMISVQVLNELANVSRRKMKMSWPEVNEILALIKSICPIEPLTIQVHDQGIALAARYKINVYDGMI
ncbi:MAG: PIN domain-containing protein, partial [Desulfovermiculus sp.]